MKYYEVLKNLRELEAKNLKKNYRGDALKCAVYRHILMLLHEIAKGKKKKPSQYSLKVGRYMKEGKSIQEAHQLAKKALNK